MEENEKIHSREGEEPRVSVFFFKVVAQAVLLFGAETWVVTPCMVRVLGEVPIPGGAAADGEAPAIDVNYWVITLFSPW